MRKIGRITKHLLICSLIMIVCLGLALSPVCAANKSKARIQLKPGYNYKLTKALKVYNGPGKSYGCVMRKALKPSARKNAVKKSKIAKLKKGTVVTCLKVNKRWIKIPSGWIKAGKNNVKPVE